MNSKDKMKMNDLLVKNSKIIKKRDEKLLKLGSLYYESKDNEKMDSIVNEIKELNNEINENIEIINQIKYTEKKCKKCNENLSLDYEFCYKCGNKAITINKLENMKLCKVCESINELENKYCFNCGNKFD